MSTSVIFIIIAIIVAIFIYKQKSNVKSISNYDKTLIQKALNNPSSNVIIASHDKSSLYIKKKDLKTLKDNNWVNDEIINFYFALLMDKINKINNNRILFLNSFFYTKLIENGYNYNNVRRWTKTEKLKKKGINGINNIFELDLIIFPINISNIHWILGVLNITDQSIEYYDSFKIPSNQCQTQYFKVMRKYLENEYRDKQIKQQIGQGLNLNEWKNKIGNMPKQNNNNDCGIFTLITAHSISNKIINPTFTQNDIPYFREKIMIDILKGFVS